MKNSHYAIVINDNSFRFLILKLFVKMCDFKFKTVPLDMAIPINVELCGIFKRSFCYHTMKERYPKILSQIIQNIIEQKQFILDIWGSEGINDLSNIITNIEELKLEVQTDKPLRPFNTDNNTDPDLLLYNQYLKERHAIDGRVTYFYTIWIFAETYIYRRIRESFELTIHLKSFDPFRKQKKDLYFAGKLSIVYSCRNLLRLVCPQKFVFETESGTVIEYTEEVKEHENDIKSNFLHLLKFCLWSNKYDLSLSNGIALEFDTPVESINTLDSTILCNHSNEIWNVLSDPNESSYVIDIVMDNAGYELHSDLCLADYIISKNLAKQINFYVKTIPWFISDVMSYDFHWLIKKLQTSDDIAEQIVGERWSIYLKSGVWKIVEDFFWTLPYDNSKMKSIRPELYFNLSKSKMIFFKGDMNYRKLFGDFKWRYSTPIEVAQRGFTPTNFCTIRTIKCNVIIGLKEGVGEALDDQDQQWMLKGDYGLIQLSPKVDGQCQCHLIYS